MITAQMLEKMGEFPWEIEFFNTHFPNGGRLKEVVHTFHCTPQRRGSVSTIIIQCPASVSDSGWETRKALIRKYMWHFEDFLADLGRNAPEDLEGATFEERLALQKYRYERETLALRCPPSVKGATFAARAAVVHRYKWSRIALGVGGSPEIKGGTWAARLALMPDDSARARLGKECPDGVKGATLKARLAVQLTDASRRMVLKKWGVKTNNR